MPILPSEYKAVGGATDLTIRQTQNPSEGVPVGGDTAYVDNAGIFTEGGLRDENALLLRYKTAFRDIGIKHLVRELMRQTGLASQIDLLTETLSEPYHLNYGNIGFQSNATRVIRTPSDWVYDDTNDIVYILMSNYQNHIADQLVEYDVVADRSRVVFEFPAEYFCVNIATADFDTFYVLTAGAADYDRLRDTGRAETQDRFLTYDSTVTGHENRILDLDISTGALAVHVDSNDAYPPQVGLHYHAGFENIFYADDWRGIVPENRATFEVYNSQLYYRYAKAGEFGVARVNAGGTTASLIDITDLSFHNHLNFDFVLDATGQVFMPYAVGDTAESTLKVSRWSSGTVTEQFSDTQALAALTVLGAEGGYYLGVHEVVIHGGDLYAVVPIQRAFSVEGQTVSARIPRNAAGAVLYKIELSPDALTVVKTYDFVTESCRSLTVHDNAVHFVESPSVAYRYKPINSELDSFNDNLGYNPIDTDGALYQINASDVPVHLGRVWFGDEDYRGTPCKALSAGGDLNMVVGSDDPQNILATNAKASDPANMLWVQRTNRLQYRLEDFGAGGSVYSALTDLALKTGSLLTTSQDLITLRDRDPFTATQNAADRYYSAVSGRK